MTDMTSLKLATVAEWHLASNLPQDIIVPIWYRPQPGTGPRPGSWPWTCNHIEANGLDPYLVPVQLCLNLVFENLFYDMIYVHFYLKWLESIIRLEVYVLKISMVDMKSINFEICCEHFEKWFWNPKANHDSWVEAWYHSQCIFGNSKWGIYRSWF